jgi:hypothetical protein
MLGVQYNTTRLHPVAWCKTDLVMARVRFLNDTNGILDADYQLQRAFLRPGLQHYSCGQTGWSSRVRAMTA